jgi:PKD repeat protein
MSRSALILVCLICVVFIPLVNAESVTTDQKISENSGLIFAIKGSTNNFSSGKQTPALDGLSSNEEILQIPPAVKKYDLVTFDQQGINTDLRSTSPHLSFQIDGTDYLSDLKRMDFESIDDGIDSYSGTLAGEANSSVLLTVSDNATIGSITLNDETYYLEPVQTKTQTKNTGRIPHIIYRSQDVENREFLIDNDPISSTNDEPGAGYQSRTLNSGIDDIQSMDTVSDGRTAVTVLIVTDNQFYSDHSGYGWKLVGQDIIAEANRQFGRDDIGVILIPVYDDSKRQDLTNSQQIKTYPLYAFKEVYPKTLLNDSSADLGLYLGGYDKTTDNDQGSSDGYGNVTHPYYGRHSWAQMVADDPFYMATTKGRRVISIHELGHQFGAHHDDGSTNPLLDTPGYNRAYEWGTFPLNHQTVMWTNYSETASTYEFSSSWPNHHGNTMHDNARRIRETKDDVAGYATCSASLPSANFEWAPESPLVWDPIQFTIISRPNNPNYFYWDFGDGTNSSIEQPKWSYNWPGTYTVMLTAGNCAGSTVTSKNITITPVSGYFSFSGTPKSGNAPLTVKFSSSVYPTPEKYNWSFGDGYTSTEENPQHIYNESGSYTVYLSVIQNNVTNTTIRPNYIDVSPQPPHADFTATPTNRPNGAPLTVRFTDTSTNDPDEWSWNFGDGNGTNATKKDPVHTYRSNGTYTVSLTATNEESGSNTTTKTNYITVGLIYATTNGAYTVLKFNSTGSTKWTPPHGVTAVDYLVVGGGGEDGNSNNNRTTMPAVAER